jgi:site-specific DNA-adenine methylase
MDALKRITMPLVYCDYIAEVIKQAINKDITRPESLLCGAGSVRFDTDANGAYLSPTKHINCADINGRLYEITIKEITK